MLTREHVHHGHTRRVIVNARAKGWEVRHETDDVVVARVQCSDWHRVERALALFDRAGEPAIVETADHSTNR